MYKVGKCKDCSYQGKLIAGRCQGCYWKYRAAVKAKNKSKDSIADDFKIENGALKSWFETQIKQAPKHCEECGTPLVASLRFIPTAIVAHIFPKRKDYGYPGVATHPLNRMFFCIDCHTNFDRLGESHVLKMQSLNLIKMRALKVYNDMPEDEQRRANKNLSYILD